MADKYIARGKVEGLELTNLNEDVYIPFSTAVKKLERAGAGPAASSSAWGWPSPPTRTSRRATTSLRSISSPITVRELPWCPRARLVKRILERRHGGVDDFEIVVPESLLRHSQRTQRIFNVVMERLRGFR